MFAMCVHDISDRKIVCVILDWMIFYPALAFGNRGVDVVGHMRLVVCAS